MLPVGWLAPSAAQIQPALRGKRADGVEDAIDDRCRSVRAAVRRVRPLTSFTGALGGLAAVYLALGHYEAGAAVIIALIAAYSAGAHGRNLPFTVAVLVAFSATTGLGQPAGQAVPDMLWSCAVLALALAVGLTVRRLLGQTQAAQRRVLRVQQEQQALAEAAAREERRRIARELHDIISHGLGVVVLKPALPNRSWSATLARPGKRSG